jgi:hypothetical protein
MPALSVALPQTDYLDLRYRPDLHLLVGRWQRSVSGAEFRQGYRAMLRAARQANCPYSTCAAATHCPTKKPGSGCYNGLCRGSPCTCLSRCAWLTYCRLA